MWVTGKSNDPNDYIWVGGDDATILEQHRAEQAAKIVLHWHPNVMANLYEAKGGGNVAAA